MPQETVEKTGVCNQLQKDRHTHTHTYVYICLGTQSCLTLVTPRTVARQAPLSIYAYIKINIYYYLCYTCVNHSLLNSFAGNVGLNFYILLCLVIYKKNYVAHTVPNFIIFLKVLSNCIPEGLCEGAKLSLSWPTLSLPAGGGCRREGKRMSCFKKVRLHCIYIKWSWILVSFSRIITHIFVYS